MWRFLQNIPRAIRQQWNGPIRSAPQTVCREDDEANQKLTRVPELLPCVRYHADWTRGEGGRGQGADWRQGSHGNQRTSRHDFCSGVHQNHTPLEAVGWGTAIILGIQLSHLCPHWAEPRYRDNQQQRQSLIGLLYRTAFASPGGLSGAAKGIKADTSTGGVTVPPTTTQGHPTQDTEDGRSETEKALDAATEEWKVLTDTYTAMSLTRAGLRHARRGRMVQAVGLWQEASQAGFDGAYFNLGVCYETGKGVDQDINKAVECYRLAAAQGHSKALYNLGVMYLAGGPGLDKDPHMALQFLQQAALNGLPQAQTELGVMYTEDEHKDMARAAELFHQAAQQKDMSAEYYLGICYENGWGVECNACRAAQHYSTAAKAGHAGAQHNLAVFFEHGLGGLPQDMNSAKELYEKASYESLPAQDRLRQIEEEERRQRSQQELLELRMLFDGGTSLRDGAQHLRHSQSSPDMLQSPPSSPTGPAPYMDDLPITQAGPSPTLVDYLRRHLVLDPGVWGDVEMDHTASASHTQPRVRQPRIRRISSTSDLDTLDTSPGNLATFTIGDQDVTEQQESCDTSLWDKSITDILSSGDFGFQGHELQLST